jgi:hypothetical protein
MPQPTTKNGLPMFAALSALQKCIRRGMEREAMQFAVEMIHTSKAYHTMVCNRLEVISHDISLTRRLAQLASRCVRLLSVKVIGRPPTAVDGKSRPVVCAAGRGADGAPDSARLSSGISPAGRVPVPGVCPGLRDQTGPASRMLRSITRAPWRSSERHILEPLAGLWR